MRALAIAAICSALCRADWIRVDSAGIELFTDVGEKTGRELITRFDQIRAIFHQAGIPEGPLRLRVLVFASRDEFHRYRQDAGGFYQSGPDRDYIALPSGPDAGRVAFHEYAHRVLRHSSVPLPKWFDEGTAEFYSTAHIQRDRLRVGDPIPAHLTLLAKEPWLDAQSLSGRDHGAIFYAESWALVHMLNLAPRWRDGMPQFVLMLAQEKPVDESFRGAFGRPMADAVTELHVYVKQMRPATVPAALETSPQPRVTRLSTEEAAIARANLAIAVNLPELASTLVSKLPASAESESMRGSVALALSDREEARKHLDRAIQLGSRDAALYFEYAMMERENGRSDAELLKEVIKLDPDFADAHFLLGVHATDARDYKGAIEHLRAATRVRPERSNYWYALAYAQANAAEREAAAVSVRRAIATAETDPQMQMAEALLAFERIEPPPKRGAVITPSSWQPREGDTRIEGTLVDFDCEGPRIRIRDRAGASMTLNILHPSEVQLVNAPQPSLQFSCGPQNQNVVVEYDRATEDVTRIEFRL